MPVAPSAIHHHVFHPLASAGFRFSFRSFSPNRVARWECSTRRSKPLVHVLYEDFAVEESRPICDRRLEIVPYKIVIAIVPVFVCCYWVPESKGYALKVATVSFILVNLISSEIKNWRRELKLVKSCRARIILIELWRFDLLLTFFSGRYCEDVVGGCV